MRNVGDTPSVVIRNRINRYGHIDLFASGVSMFPYIRDGDICRFERILPADIRIGEVVLFFGRDSRLVGHRFLKTVSEDGETLLQFKGDTNRMPDSPVDSRQILGRLIWVKRQEQSFNENGIRRRLWTWMVIHIPLVSRGCRRLVTFQKIWMYRRSQVHNLLKQLLQ